MCLFCSIVNGEIPSNKILENDDFIAFHDINPKAPIHILIIPKIHFDSLQTVNPEIMAKMTPFIQEVAKLVGVDKTGYRVISNVGEDGGQEVKHLHIHLLGGTKLHFGHFHDADPKNNL